MRQIARQFIKYTIVGGSGVFLDLGTLALFTEVFLLVPWVAVATNQLIVIGYNFTLNKYWSFRNAAMPHWQLVRYLLLAGLNYLFAVKMMYIFNTVLEYPYVWVRVVTIALSVAWNFLLYKHWVFTSKKNTDVIHKGAS